MTLKIVQSVEDSHPEQEQKFLWGDQSSNQGKALFLSAVCSVDEIRFYNDKYFIVYLERVFFLDTVSLFIC